MYVCMYVCMYVHNSVSIIVVHLELRVTLMDPLGVAPVVTSSIPIEA